MKAKFLFLILLTGIFSVGCKPTEKGYKNAYDAALNKRQAALDAIDAKIPAEELQEIDGMQIKTIDGVKVFLLQTRLKQAGEDSVAMESYNVAVGSYKMITNCKAQVEALKEENFNAFVAEDSDGMYFAVAGSFQFLNEAVRFYKEYRKDSKRVYVGLHNAPVIIYSPK